MLKTSWRKVVLLKLFISLAISQKNLFRLKSYGESSLKKNLILKLLSRSLPILSNYFRQKRYQKNGFVSYRQLAEGLILVFQGKDPKGRAIRLLLSNPKNKDSKVGENITLTLSYIEKPEDPDVFKIKDGDF